MQHAHTTTTKHSNTLTLTTTHTRTHNTQMHRQNYIDTLTHIKKHRYACIGIVHIDIHSYMQNILLVVHAS